MKLARHYQSLLDSGKCESRAALARHLGVSRASVTQVLGRIQYKTGADLSCWDVSGRTPPFSRTSIIQVAVGDMTEVTQILSALAAGDPRGAEELLPLVYDELRKLAAARLALEQPGYTLQPTALVHEAYLRLVGDGQPHDWYGRGHFFAAAAEAMRRILINRARDKHRLKRSGKRKRVDLDALIDPVTAPVADLLELDKALERLAQVNAQAAELVKLRYFAGFTQREAASALGLPTRSADRLWAFARAWLIDALDRT
jgi:RNA polymerase sigma factor (TIGR02999 family)